MAINSADLNERSKCRATCKGFDSRQRTSKVVLDVVADDLNCSNEIMLEKPIESRRVKSRFHFLNCNYS
jgi:hypothetical protein